MNFSKAIEVNSKERFEYAKECLLGVSGSMQYSETWSKISQSKRKLYDLLPIFWITPLAYGLKELEECDCDRFLRWLDLILSEFTSIKKFCRQPHPASAKLHFEVPIVLFETTYNANYRVTNLYKGLRDLTDIDFDLLSPPSPVGRISYESEDGYFFNANTLKYLYQYWRIHNFAEEAFSKRDFRLLEIGGGYGGFAYQLLHRHKNANVVIVDIPETMIISIYFLRQNFPKVQMALHMDFDGQIDWDAYQVHFIPSYYAGMIYGTEFDIAVNSNSFLEMRQEDIDMYFNLIQVRNKVRYFYNYNRKVRVEGERTYKFDELPYDDHWIHVLDQEALFDSSYFKMKNIPAIERMSARLQ